MFFVDYFWLPYAGILTNLWASGSFSDDANACDSFKNTSNDTPSRRICFVYGLILVIVVYCAISSDVHLISDESSALDEDSVSR